MKPPLLLLLSACAFVVIIAACDPSSRIKPGPNPGPVAGPPGGEPPIAPPIPVPKPNWAEMDAATCRSKSHPGALHLGMCSAQGMRDETDPALSFAAGTGTPRLVKAAEKTITGTGAIDLERQWTKSTLRVCFFDDPHGLQDKVMAWANRWNTVGGANLTFVKTASPQDSDIRVTFQGQGYWSYIGTVAALPRYRGKVTMSLSFNGRPSASELRRVSLHEFGHAIGLVHEHQQPLAKINWNRDAVTRYFMSPPNCWSETMVRQQILNPIGGNLDTTTYDPESIMAYGIHDSLTLDGRGTTWNTDLSPTDRNFIARVYPKPGATPPIPPP